MPNRIIREGFLDSEAVNKLTETAEIFYHRLMLVVDDYGRFEADPALLLSKLFWRQIGRWTVERIADALHECGTVMTSEDHPLVTIYSVGKRRYLQINNFRQVMRAKRERYPGPEHATCIHSADAERMPNTCTASAQHVRSEEKRRESESEGKGRESEENPPTPPKPEPSTDLLPPPLPPLPPPPLPRPDRSDPKLDTTVSQDNGDIAEFVDRMYALSLKKRDRILAEHAICDQIGKGAIGPNGVPFREFERRWRAYNESEKPQYAQTLAAWTTDRNFRYEPTLKPPEINELKSKGMILLGGLPPKKMRTSA